MELKDKFRIYAAPSITGLITMNLFAVTVVNTLSGNAMLAALSGAMTIFTAYQTKEMCKLSSVEKFYHNKR